MKITSFFSLYTSALCVVGVYFSSINILHSQQYSWEYINTKELYGGYHSVSRIVVHKQDVYARLANNYSPLTYAILHTNNSVSRIITHPQYHYPFDSTGNIEHMTTDKNGALWLCVNNRLLKFFNDKWQMYFLDDSLANDCRYTSCESDSLGNIWITRRTLYPVNTMKKTRGYYDILRFDGNNFNLMQRGFFDSPTQTGKYGAFTGITITADGDFWAAFNPEFLKTETTKRLLQFRNGEWIEHDISIPGYSPIGRFIWQIISHKNTIILRFQQEVEKETFPTAVLSFDITNKTVVPFSTKSAPFYKYVYFNHCTFSPKGELWGCSIYGFHKMRTDSVLQSFQAATILQIPKEDPRFWQFENGYIAVVDNNDDLWLGTNMGIIRGRIQTSIVEQSQSPQSYIYPNPIIDNFTISSEYDINSIELYDNLGQKNILAAKQRNTFSAKHLQNGMYSVKATVNNETISFPVIICH